MPSPSADALSSRDRRALRLGAIAAAVVIVVAAAIPLARRWSAREALIEARTAELARLRGLADPGAALATAVATRRDRMAGTAQRPLRAATTALAAGELQALLQAYADESRLAVEQLDVVGDAQADGDALPALPATLVARGDIYGVADLLGLLHGGARLLEVQVLTLQSAPSLDGDDAERLQVTVVVRAPVVVE